jgi:hypothetical protein
MRPVLDPRLFPGLPKFLWFDDGDAGDAGASSGVGGSGGTSATDSGNASANNGNSTDAGSTDSVTANQGDTNTGEVSAAAQASVNASVNAAAAQAAAQAANQGGAPGGATAPGASTGGGPSTSAVGHSGVTGGGGGTASGGASSGAVQGMNPSVVNSLIQAGLMSVPPGVLSGVNTATTPVNVSPLAAPNQSAFAAFPSAVSQANSGLSSLAQQVFGAGSSAAPGPNNPSLVGKVSAQTGPTMGFPAYEGASPGLGGFGGHAASPGPTQGSPSVIGPAGPNGPSAFASNMDTAPGPTAAPTANENSLAQAAKTAQAQTNATTTAPSPSSPNTAGGPLFQLILGLLGGTPSLNNLARSAGTT